MKLIALILALVSASAFASCESESIKSKSEDGRILVMLDGSVWEVDEADRVDSALWLPTDDVLICDDDTIINTDENAEKVDAKRIK